METLEKSRVCRLCGENSGISINIFDKNENHVKKINAILPIMVHEMDLLPKHFCHRCSYKVEEFYKFFVKCLNTDTDLKNKLSWMRKKDAATAAAVTSNGNKNIGIPMVHIENVRIKVEPPDHDDMYILNPSNTYIKPMNYPVATRIQTAHHDPSNRVAYTTYSSCRCYCNNEKQHNERQLLSRTMTDADILPTTDSMALTTSPTNINSKRDDRLNPINPCKKNWETRKNFTKGKSRSSQRNDKGHRSRDKPLLLKNVLSSSDDSLNISFASSTPSTSVSPLRNLRPRNNSVDHNSGVKKKVPVSSSSFEVRSTSGSINHDLNQSLEDVEVDREPRSLRPRKVVNYLNCNNKSQYEDNQYRVLHEHDGSLIYDMKKELSTPDATTNSLDMSINEIEDDDDDDDNDDDLFKNTASVKSESSNSFSVHLRIDKDLVKEKKKNISFKLKDKYYGKTGGNNSNYKQLKRFKANKMSMSPKYLRSQDTHLRSGRVKSIEGVGRSHEFGKKVRILENRRLNINLFNIIKEGLQRNMNDTSERNVKHLCDKCDVIFANFELYKLHGCYNS